MHKGRTHYDVLRVSPDAEPELIASSYRTLMTKLKKHPDLGGNTREAEEINRAYEVLSDSDSRKAYDKNISSGASFETHDENTEVERRRVPRIPSDATIAFCIGHDQCWHPARVRDMSVLGLRIQSHAEISTGEHLVIVPPNLAAPAIHGTVKWTRMFHPSVFERIYEAGIEFSDQITDIEQRLDA